MPDAPDRPVLLAVDGNSLLHRSYHAFLGSGTRTAAGAATWAIRGFFSQLGLLVDRVAADGLVVGFDDAGNNRRKVTHPEYKATRGEKDPDLVAQLRLAVRVLRDAGAHVVVPEGLEADDVVAAAARDAAAAGWDTVIATSDRDAFALVDGTTRLLRLISGGVDASPVLTRDRMRLLTGVWPEQYRELAALRGDTSDNLAGVRGIGPKTGARLLSELGTVRAALADPERTRVLLGARVAEVFTSAESQEVFARNVELMTPEPVTTGLDLAAGPGRLPLDEHAVRAALERVELGAVCRPAVRALCGLGFAPPPVPSFASAPAPRRPVVVAAAAPARETEWTLF
ncbi:hypothetical protein RHODO2019_15035 [Rhodococcus antarcticus]|uniref:5'-3' exonuclease n=1 Tax=Rhodococcus antarcticus TaxID=2987751 RepID=A0ABY6NYK3_9NOCA|nr:5'-3' exonuclease H3TH domain-containing protein [Rhodococcus antarcticus]UZJ24440.1 hypothetical protein RHODO2019_15035 [Rhodococcus antarcticus]